MPLALSFFAAYTVYGVVSPYLSVLVRSLGYGPAVVGLLLGLYEVAGIAGPFLSGRLADRQRRYKPSLALAYGLIGAALAPLVYLRHPAVSALAIIILAVGVKSIIPLLDAAATVRLGPSGDYGRVRVVGSVSFVLMTLTLQFTPILKPDAAPPIAAWAGVTIVLSFVALAFLDERRPAPAGGSSVSRLFTDASGARQLTGSAPRFGTAPTASGVTTARWDRFFLIGLLMIALNRLAMAPIYSFFSLYAKEELRWDAVGLLWAIAAASEIPFMFFSSRLIHRFGPVRLLAVSSAAVIVRLAIYALFPNRIGAVAGQLLHSLCFGLFHPAAVAFVSLHVPPEKRAMGMAVYLSFGVGLPTFLGSSAGGFIVEAAGYRTLFAAFIPFALASLAIAVPMTRRRGAA